MTEVIVPEGGNGITRELVINRRGQTAAENLSSFTGATMAVVSFNHRTIYNSSITLAITDSANGVLTWTLDSGTDALPTVPDNKASIKVIGQVTLTGSGITDRTEEYTIKIEKNITS